MSLGAQWRAGTRAGAQRSASGAWTSSRAFRACHCLPGPRTERDVLGVLKVLTMLRVLTVLRVPSLRPGLVMPLGPGARQRLACSPHRRAQFLARRRGPRLLQRRFCALLAKRAPLPVLLLAPAKAPRPREPVGQQAVVRRQAWASAPVLPLQLDARAPSRRVPAESQQQVPPSTTPFHRALPTPHQASRHRLPGATA